jgi:arginine/lysine/histidine transporter system substrate-binding protein
VQLGTIADTEATNIKDAQVSRMSKDADSVQDLLNGKLDAVMLDINPAQVFAGQNPDKIKLVEKSLRDDVYAVAAKKGNADLLKVVNDVIKELKDSGQFNKILDKYGIASK